MAPRGGRKSKTFQKKVKEVVREQLTKELEEKTAVVGLDMTQVDFPGINNGNVSANTSFIELFPSITQGTKQYNSRVGNEIRLKHIDLSMLLNYNLLGNRIAEDSVQDAGIGVRVMIIRQKDHNSSEAALEDFQGKKLLENGAITTPGPASFTGVPFNLMQKINREQFAVKYDKVHYLNASYVNSGGTIPNPTNAPVVPPKIKVIKERLTFGKNGLKLTYGDSASTLPTNFPWFMVLGYASTVSPTKPSEELISYSYSANAAYTDA